MELIWSGELRDGAFSWVDKNRSILEWCRGYLDLENSDEWNDSKKGGLAQMLKHISDLVGLALIVMKKNPDR